METPGSYVDTLLSLKDSVYYVVLVDPTTQKALGKVVHHGRNTHFKANNSTAAHLLYLLSRSRSEELHFEQLKELVMLKYGLAASVAESELNTFLDKLNSIYTVTLGGKSLTFGILDINTTGNITETPDPCGLFNIPATWDPNPDLIQGPPPIIRDNRHYGCGNSAYTIRK
jgi:hypothetical protein